MATKVKETDEEHEGSGEASPADVTSSGSDVGSAIEPVGAQASEWTEPAESKTAESEDAEQGRAAVYLGSTRYVHAAFFAAGILAAYLSGKIITLLWNSLAEWPAAVRAIPVLLSYGESERDSFGLVAGAAIGVITVVQTYRKEHVRRWANDVAGELAKVTWPNRETVTNGTIVVVIASMIATAYVALLDRFWSFVTNLVYGA
jgi:preprotein translocase subunit SecE